MTLQGPILSQHHHEKRDSLSPTSRFSRPPRLSPMPGETMAKFQDNDTRPQERQTVSRACRQQNPLSLARTNAVQGISNNKTGEDYADYEEEIKFDGGKYDYDEVITTERIRSDSISQQQPSPARSVRFDFDGKVNDSAAASPATHWAPLPTSDVPFSDGIFHRGGVPRERQTINAPSSIALKLDWPLDMTGYNEVREGFKSSSSLSLPGACGPTLVYYRKYLEMRQKGAHNVGTVLLQKTKGAKSSSVMFRATCESPCWTTASRRYEAPIRIGLGRAGPVLWEAVPTLPKKKQHQTQARDSNWSLIHVPSGYQTRMRDEDLEMVRFSAVDEADFVYVGVAQAHPRTRLLYDGQEIEVAHFDRNDELGVLHMDSRPAGTPFSQTKNDPIDFAFLVAVNEVINAIRDEVAGGGKGRRDNHGRLLPPKKTGLSKVLSRLLLRD